MTWNRLVLISAGILFGTVVLLVIFVFTMDLGIFKNQIARYAGDFLGRPVTLDGNVTIKVGSEIRVVANGIRLAGTDWAAESDLLSIDHAAITIDTASLFSNVIVVEDLTIHDISAYLVEDVAGRNNYSLPVFEDTDAPPSAPVRLFLARASITDLAVTYVSPAFNSPLSFRSSNIDLQQQANDDLGVELTGSLNETPVTFSSTIGTMDDLIAATNVHFDLTAAIGDIDIEGSGLIDDLVDPRRPRLNLKLDGPGAEYVTDILLLDPITTGPLHFEGQIEPDGEAIAMTVDGVFGEFNIEANAALTDLQAIEDFHVTAKAAGPSMGRLGNIVGRTDYPALPYIVDVEVRRAGSALTVERFLFRAGEAAIQITANVPQLPGINGATADLLVRGPEFGRFNQLLGLPGNLTGPFEIAGRLVQSEIRGALNVQLTSEAIQAELNADISEREDFTGTRATVVTSGEDLSIIATALGIAGLPGLPFGARADLDILEEGIRIGSGSATLAADEILFDGIVGRDPFSPITRLSVSSTLADPAATLRPFDVDTTYLPAGEISLAAEIGRTSNAFVLEEAIIRAADSEILIDGRVADTFELADMFFTLRFSGASLADLLPADAGPVPAGPFRVSANVGFDADTIELSGIEAELAGTSVKLSVRTSLEAPFETGSITLAADGTSLIGVLPMASDYLPAGQAYSVRGGSEWSRDAISLQEVVFQAGEALLQVDGTVALPPETGYSKLSVNGRLASLKNLQFLTDLPLPDEPVSLRGEFAGNPEKLRVSLLEFELGRTSLTGTVLIQPESASREVPVIDVTVRSPMVDLSPFRDLLTQSGDAAESTSEPASDRLIPEVTIPSDLFPQLQIGVDLTIEQLLVAGYDLASVVFLGHLEDGALQVERFHLTGAEVDLAGKLAVTPAGNGMAVQFRVDGTDMTLGMPVDSEEERSLLPRYDTTIKLASQGATLREHASSATGYIKLVSGEGQLDLSIIRFLARDFAGQVLNTINPFTKKEKHSNVRCLGVLIELDDGILFGDPAMVLRTDKLNVAGVGRVDLSTEKLNAKFNTRARSGLGISMTDIVSPYTEVGGTLADPHLQLNSASALFRGSATIATGGLSFLIAKAGQRVFGAKNPCRDAIAEAEADIVERNL